MTDTHEQLQLKFDERVESASNVVVVDFRKSKLGLALADRDVDAFEKEIVSQVLERAQKLGW